MVRRVMEGSRRFGMATVDPRTGRLRRVGCEAEVLECQPQPDGRFYLEIVGRRRFRIGEDWETDGYRVCSARFFRDSPPADAAAAAEVASLSSSVEALADAWVKRARAAGRADARVLDVLARAGDKPPPGTARGAFVLGLEPDPDGRGPGVGRGRDGHEGEAGEAAGGAAGAGGPRRRRRRGRRRQRRVLCDVIDGEKKEKKGLFLCPFFSLFLSCSSPSPAPLTWPVTQ